MATGLKALPPPYNLIGQYFAGLAKENIKEATKELPPFLTLLPPIPFRAPTFEQLLESALLQDNVFPTGPPRVPAGPVAIPWGRALELLLEGGRLLDNVFPEGLPKPFLFDTPVGPWPIFASLTTEDIEVSLPAGFNQSMISNPAFAVNGGAPMSGPTHTNAQGQTISNYSGVQAFTAENGQITMSPNPDPSPTIESP